MNSTYLNEALETKWAPILDNPLFSKIKDSSRRDITGILLENTQKNYLTEAAPLTSVSQGGVTNWEPVLINLVRRTMPSLVAYDLCSVQPMTGPVGQIFAMRSQYADDAAKANWNEALFREVRTDYSGTKGGSDQVTDMFEAGTNNNIIQNVNFKSGTGVATASAEDWGNSPTYNQMSFTIDKTTVTAKSRALKAEYSTELEQDLKQIRGMSVEAELINILSTEIGLEINREVLYTILGSAVVGMQQKADYKGIFDGDTDSDGRWSVEKWKGLLYHIEREANQVAKDTRRGKANFVLCTSDVASALAMAQVLDYTPALQQNLEVDDTGNIFCGTLAGRYKVYIDPYWAGSYDYVCVGYKGASNYDAGVFYCPYIPVEMVRAINPTTFQPSIGFKSRFGIVSNPFVTAYNGADGLTGGTNFYQRKFKVTGLL